jgi:hypothetical protein
MYGFGAPPMMRPGMPPMNPFLNPMAMAEAAIAAANAAQAAASAAAASRDGLPMEMPLSEVEGQETEAGRVGDYEGSDEFDSPPTLGSAEGASPTGAFPLGFPSRGSASHPGKCRPCAWFWKAQGCQSEQDCSYCHLCPEGELKSRKKLKVAAMRMGALTPAKGNQQGTTTAPRTLKLNPLL